MKKSMFFTFLSAFVLTSCSMQNTASQSESAVQPVEPITSVSESNSDYTPLNYQNQIGQWFPYMDFENYMYGKSEDEFREAVREKFSDAEKNSVNTVYLHVHPCGDCYYMSDIFPRGTFFDGDYDPFQIMLDEAHSMGLSVHAWINPLRCQTADQMNGVSEDFTVKKWAEDSECEYVKTVGDRWYLNPAYQESADLVCSCVGEIMDKYSVDGIHIDDYFYPTTDPDFDRTAFEKSGSTSLAEWRTENCSRLVKSIYDTVKSHDSRVLFGISPQGNVSADYETQYADVKRWFSESGFCDYAVPQIYYGFKNQTCPFERTLAEWEGIVKNPDISLVIGLACYKQGNNDIWAGEAGEYEWIENPFVIKQQVEMVKNSSASGYAFYY